MHYINLLCASASAKDLESFASAFFEGIGAANYQKRESSNFPGGNYFKSTEQGISYSISFSDDDEHEKLPYWIQISADSISAEILRNTIDTIVTTKVLPKGFRVAHVSNFGKRNEIIEEYQ